MSRRKECSKVELLNCIPEGFVKIILRLSLVLFCLNMISLVLTLIYHAIWEIAAINTGISLCVVIISFFISKNQNDLSK